MRTQSVGIVTRLCSCSTLALLLALGAGCTTTSPGGGTGGAAAGSGGASASGGSQGNGGSPSGGGALESGGVAASGGASGSGGTTVKASGGATANGGSTGSGGSWSGGGSMGGSDSGSGACDTGCTCTYQCPDRLTPTTGSVVVNPNAPDPCVDCNTECANMASALLCQLVSAEGNGKGGAVKSAGCGKMPTLKNNGYNTLTSGGTSRQYYLRWPPSYDNSRAYRLILSLHGATGKGTDVAPGFWGLYDLSNGSTIFIAPDASGGLWSAASDTTFVDDILKAVEADLCIDTTRVELEGFSQGAAMSWTLACSRPGVFRAVVGHSGGGVANPTTCQPVAYFGSGGLQENVTQTTQTDQFAKWDGCTIETFAKAPTGGHACYDYTDCSAGHPVRWCPYDGPHTPSPTDSGKSTSWMPSEVWPFFSQF